MNLAYYLQIEYIIHSTNGLKTVQKLNSTDQDKKWGKIFWFAKLDS